MLRPPHQALPPCLPAGQPPRPSPVLALAETGRHLIHLISLRVLLLATPRPRRPQRTFSSLSLLCAGGEHILNRLPSSSREFAHSPYVYGEHPTGKAAIRG